jgi:hypothetical protein
MKRQGIADEDPRKPRYCISTRDLWVSLENLVWWVLVFTLGLDIPFTSYFHLSVVLAIMFFMYGLFRSNKGDKT